MGLKDRLAGRKRPAAVYWLLVEEDKAAELEEQLADARARYQTLMVIGADAERITAAEAEVDRLQKAVRDCYEPIKLYAMEPDEFEALVDDHPKRPDTDDEIWNTKTLPRETFLRCAPEEMTRAEWEDFLKVRVSQAEREALYNLAVAANVRTPSPLIPKDLMEIPS